MVYVWFGWTIGCTDLMGRGGNDILISTRIEVISIAILTTITCWTYLGQG